MRRRKLFLFVRVFLYCTVFIGQGGIYLMEMPQEAIHVNNNNNRRLVTLAIHVINVQLLFRSKIIIIVIPVV